MNLQPGVLKQGTGVKVQNANGDIINPASGFAIPAFNYIGVNLAGSTTDVYTYKSGGSGGTTVATLTITYTSSAKTTIASVLQT